MELRQQFVLEAKAAGANVAELCRQHGISRKTGYKWIKRFEEGGVEALRDMSRRPHRALHATDGELVLRVIEARHAHPTWGPKKLRALLLRKGVQAPTVRTIARILERAGEPLVRPCRRIVQAEAVQRPQVTVQQPNDVWTVDFKGWWRTRQGERCEPLTVRDAMSRYVLCAAVLASTKWETVRDEFVRLFERYGLPLMIHVDNGGPFIAVTARCGLTRLSAWWVSLGIRVIRSRLGCPQDAGGHERMHGDMAMEVERYPAATIQQQRQALERWRQEFNDVRPHEALGMKTPAQLYRTSPRRYRGPRLPCYPDGTRTLRADHGGYIEVHGTKLFLGRGLAHGAVGVTDIADGAVSVHYYEMHLGDFSLRTSRVG